MNLLTSASEKLDQAKMRRISATLKVSRMVIAKIDFQKRAERVRRERERERRKKSSDFEISGRTSLELL